VRTTQEQVKGAEAQVANAAATVKQREAALDSSKNDLEKTSITAPVNGVVISRQVDAGQTVAASLNTPTLFTIAEDLSKMQVAVVQAFRNSSGVCGVPSKQPGGPSPDEMQTPPWQVG